MPTAYAIASRQYERPKKQAPDCRPRSGLRYSCYAAEILHFFSRHRTALASHVRRYLPHRFKTDRDARRHLQTLVEAGDLSVVTYNDSFRPNMYMLTDHGLDRAADVLGILSSTLPENRAQSSGAHLLHECLITEVALARYEHVRRFRGFKHLWEARFEFSSIPGFEAFVPDYAQVFQCARGQMLDFLEVYSGERSITKVRDKLAKYATWAESEDAQEFLLRLYRFFGAPEPRPEFRITIVAHNRNVVSSDHAWERQILGAAFSVPTEIQRRVWTTTNAALHRADTIDDPIWHCGANLVQLRQRYHDLPKRRRTKFLATKLSAEVPRHPLFSFTDPPNT